MPWWTKRASGPTISAKCVRKAMTSCFVTASIASIRATSNTASRPLSQTACAASRGTTPISASAVVACASISNQIRKRLSGDQIAVMAGRL